MERNSLFRGSFFLRNAYFAGCELSERVPQESPRSRRADPLYLELVGSLSQDESCCESSSSINIFNFIEVGGRKRNSEKGLFLAGGATREAVVVVAAAAAAGAAGAPAPAARRYRSGETRARAAELPRVIEIDSLAAAALAVQVKTSRRR